MIDQKPQITPGQGGAANNNGADNDDSHTTTVENPYTIRPEKDLAAKYVEMERRLKEMEEKFKELKKKETTP